MDTLDYQSPSAILILKYQMTFKDSNMIINRWLGDHPEESRKTLSELLQSRKVIFKDNKLCDLPQLSAKEARLLIQEIQQSQTLEVKDRRYQFQEYPRCFVGSELVDWLKQNKDLLTEEAISIGQSLLEHNLIQHVCNDHDFENSFLFYRYNKTGDLPQLSKVEAELLIQEIQQSQTLEVKDRRYHLKQYLQCFIGSELVDWLKQNKDLLTEEAISIGQSLLKHNFIQHVSNDHDFENSFLFYRFQKK